MHEVSGTERRDRQDVESLAKETKQLELKVRYKLRLGKKDDLNLDSLFEKQKNVDKDLSSYS